MANGISEMQNSWVKLTSGFRRESFHGHRVFVKTTHQRSENTAMSMLNCLTQCKRMGTPGLLKFCPLPNLWKQRQNKIYYCKGSRKNFKKIKIFKMIMSFPLQIGCIGNLGGDSISPWRHQSIGESQLFLGIIFPNIYSEGWYLFSTFVESRLFNRLPDLHVSARAALFDSSRFRIASITWHPLWLAITSTILLVLRQLDDMHNTILPFDCWLWSRLFYRVKG